MLPPTSSSAAPPVAQGQSPGCAGDTGDAQQSWSGCRKTALQLSTHRIPSYHFFRGAGLGWGGGGWGGSFKFEMSMEIVFQTASLQLP